MHIEVVIHGGMGPGMSNLFKMGVYTVPTGQMQNRVCSNRKGRAEKKTQERSVYEYPVEAYAGFHVNLYIYIFFSEIDLCYIQWNVEKHVCQRENMEMREAQNGEGIQSSIFRNIDSSNY